MISESWAELGGQIDATPTRRVVLDREQTPQPKPQHVHRFDALSGYCTCGRRDDGTTAEGSEAWAGDREIRDRLGRIERQLDALATTAEATTGRTAS